MKQFLKEAGRNTVVALAVLALIGIIILLEKVTSIDWKLLLIAGGIGLGYRYLSIKEAYLKGMTEVNKMSVKNAVAETIRKLNKEAEEEEEKTEE